MFTCCISFLFFFSKQLETRDGCCRSARAVQFPLMSFVKGLTLLGPVYLHPSMSFAHPRRSFTLLYPNKPKKPSQRWHELTLKDGYCGCCQCPTSPLYDGRNYDGHVGYVRSLVASKISRVIVTYCNSGSHSLRARV